MTFIILEGCKVFFKAQKTDFSREHCCILKKCDIITCDKKYLIV